MSFSSSCLPDLLTVKLVVAARRPPRTSSWDCALLLAADPDCSAENKDVHWMMWSKEMYTNITHVFRQMLTFVTCILQFMTHTKNECKQKRKRNLIGCQHTGDGRLTGAALPPEFFQRVHGYVEVDVLTATAVVHQLLLIKTLEQKLHVFLLKICCFFFF